MTEQNVHEDPHATTPDTGACTLGHIARADVCGLAPSGSGLMASDGHGGIIALRAEQADPLTRHERNWDNHLASLDG